MGSVDGDSQSKDQDILVPGSQGFQPSSEPPRKKRKTHIFSSLSDREESSSSQDFDLPSNDVEDYIEVDDDILENYRSKYEAVMYEPEFVESQKNTYVTQLDELWSSPTRIRGPRWRKKSPTPSVAPKSATAISHTPLTSTRPLVAEEFDDEELEALMNDEATQQSEVMPVQNEARPGRQLSKSMRQTTLFGASTTQSNRSAATQKAHNYPLAQRNEPLTHHKINEEAMTSWIYPLNVGSIRDYQFNIVSKALFNNILVALPTGLGKTFIAATVMLNWYRWTKDAQIVFMAPTKPLVAQQVDACFHIAGIPRSQTTLMTGEIPASVRAEEWLDKRVFFMTPQTLINDLKSGIADPKKIVLLVIDEAHKGTGNYAYVEVIKFIQRFSQSFRVLALTATPGATVEAVQKVINSLNIARVEIRTEDSLDIRSFVHTRNTEVETFDFSEEQQLLIELFGQAIKPVMDKLCSQNAWWGRDPTQITLFGLMQSRAKWLASDVGRKANMGVKGMLHACFTPLMSLAHNLELLKFHGITPFYHKMKAFQDESAGSNGKYTRMIIDSQPFRDLMAHIRTWIQNDDFVGHPKLEYLNRVVLNHFMDASAGNLHPPTQAPSAPIAPSDTRIMIFAHYRDSAEDITRILSRHAPLIRPHVFVGQTATKKSDGMDQKAQIDIIKKFKSGIYNTLVATSIGEEGLDIGEVDLIVCYDSSKSPIRMLQRMGRTGRKRAGNIVSLLMKQKEEKDYYAAKDNHRKMQEIIESGREFEFKVEESRRIVPKHIQPVADKRVVEIPVENTQGGSIEPSKSKTKNRKAAKKPPKKFFMPDNVETGFQFLGSKGKKTAEAKKNKPESTSAKKKKEPYIEQDVPLPPITDILLSPAQESDLSDRYATVAGTQEQYIRVVNLSARPDKLRRLDKTARIKHSASTQRYIAAGQAMSSDRDWTRPTKPPLSLEHAQSKRRSRNERTEDELFYTSQRLPATIQHPPRREESPQPFYVSQQAHLDPEQDDEMPDLDQMFKENANAKVDMTGTVNSGSSVKARTKDGRRKKRKVVSDDDEEDQ